MFAEDYEPSLKEYFLGNKALALYKTHGMPNNSYEFRLYNGKFVYDIFFFYKENATHQWNAYHGNKKIYR
jgi:hypothetical protein